MRKNAKNAAKKENGNNGEDLFAAVDLLESTKGIPRAYLLEKIEAALVSAYKKEKNASNVRISLDPEQKTIRMFRQKTVVEEVEDPQEQISLEDAHAISLRYEPGDVIEDEVSFELNNGHSPVLIRCSVPFLYVLMPLRFN